MTDLEAPPFAGKGIQVLDAPCHDSGSWGGVVKFLMDLQKSVKNPKGPIRLRSQMVCFVGPIPCWQSKWTLWGSWTCKSASQVTCFASPWSGQVRNQEKRSDFECIPRRQSPQSLPRFTLNSGRSRSMWHLHIYICKCIYIYSMYRYVFMYRETYANTHSVAIYDSSRSSVLSPGGSMHSAAVPQPGSGPVQPVESEKSLTSLLGCCSGI